MNIEELNKKLKKEGIPLLDFLFNKKSKIVDRNNNEVYNEEEVNNFIIKYKEL